VRGAVTNIPAPRGIPRSRRLLPNSPDAKQRGTAVSRHALLLPPPDDSAEPTLTRTLTPAAPAVTDRWSVRLELGDDDIAKLYGQGLTRGAVVWKKGMVEWRPLLITPELGGLLRRTRTTINEAPSVPYVSEPDIGEEPTLPRPPRVPENIEPIAVIPAPPAEPHVARFTTVAPTALDVAPLRSMRRHRIELAAVAIGAFALAWLTHSRFQSSNAPPASAAVSAAAALTAVPACEPAPATLSERAASGSNIPTVAVADLPLVGDRSSSSSLLYANVAPTKSAASAQRAARGVDGSRPSRSDLVAALSQVARAASGCGERSGPARVMITFAKTGVARSIQVSGAGLPSQTRSCIIGAASRARVPAFSGDPVTVAKTL
jgi:hypothetical protein